MSLELTRKPNETDWEYHKRLIRGKLVDKSLNDTDFYELSQYLYGKTIASDNARRMSYGSKITMELAEKEINNILNREKKDEVVANNYKDKVEINLNKDGTQTQSKFIEMTTSQSKDPNYLLEAHGFSPKLYNLVSAKNSVWQANSSSKDEEGNPLPVTLYSSKITVKPKEKDAVDFKEIEEWFKDFEPKILPKIEYPSNYGEGENLLLIPIVDLHYNLLASTFTSSNDYNCEIAKNNLIKIITEILERTKDKDIDRILFPIGNDLFNANGIANTTFRGTPQDCEKHIFEAYKELMEIMYNVIEMLRQKAPVDVIFVPSNHDKEVTYYFMYNLYTQYKNENNVQIEYSPLPRKYYEYGSNLLVFTHDVKIEAITRTILDEGGKHLNGVRNIEVLLAHLHSETVKQDKNITIRRLPSTTGKSIWTNDSNYSAKRQHMSFIYNKEYGLTDIMYVII